MRFCFFVVWADEKKRKKMASKNTKKDLQKISFFIFFRHINCARKKTSETTHGDGRKKIEKEILKTLHFYFFSAY